MRNSFLFNIILLICINVLIKPAYIFAVEIPVQNYVGNIDYGMYFTFLNLAYIFQLMTDFGLQNLTLAELPRDRSRLSALWSNGAMLRVLFAVLFVFVMGLTGLALGYWSLDSKLFGVVMLNVFLISCLQYVRANISGMGLYFQDSLISALDKLLMLGILLFLLYGMSRQGFSIHTFAWVQTLSIILAICAGLLVLKGRIRWIKPDWVYMKTLFRQALPYGILIALMFLYTRLDAIMIEQLLTDGLDQAGLYAGAYRLYDAVTMISYLFATLLLPMFTELEKDVAARDKLYYGSLNMIIGMSLLIAIPLIIARTQVMNSLYDVTTVGAIQSLAWLLGAFILKSSLFVTSTLLTSAKRLDKLIRLCAIGIVLNFTVNYLLIPKMGIVGAAWATFATQILIAVGCLLLCHDKGLIVFEGKQYIKIIKFALPIVCIGYWITVGLTEKHLYLALGCFILVGGLYYLLLNHRQIAQLSSRITRR